MNIGKEHDDRNIKLFVVLFTTLALGVGLGNAYATTPLETICHNGITIAVAPEAIPAHQAHGDTLGECIPSSEGSNSPGSSSIPDPVSQGNPTNISFEESNEAPHGSRQGIFIYSPTASVNTVGGGPLNSCPMQPAISGDYWVLLTLGGQVINYYIPNTALDNAEVTVPFGTGADVVITPFGGARVGTGDPTTAPNPNTFGQNTPLPARWHKVVNTNVLVNPPSQYAVQGGTGNSDNTNELGTHIAISCGREGNNFPNNYETGVDFVVITAVGGEIISVDTAALVIAGLTTSVIWIVPTLVTVTGIGVTLYKLRK